MGPGIGRVGARWTRLPVVLPRLRPTIRTVAQRCDARARRQLRGAGHCRRGTPGGETIRARRDRAATPRGRSLQLVAVVPGLGTSPLLNSRRSHARAKFQSLTTVFGATPNTSAISSTLNP